MVINLVCDGSSETVRVCQGVAIQLCSKADFDNVEEKEAAEFIKQFKDGRLYDQTMILSFIIALAMGNPSLPVLEIIDYFSYHRHHNLYLELGN